MKWLAVLHSTLLVTIHQHYIITCVLSSTAWLTNVKLCEWTHFLVASPLVWSVSWNFIFYLTKQTFPQRRDNDNFFGFRLLFSIEVVWWILISCWEKLLPQLIAHQKLNYFKNKVSVGSFWSASPSPGCIIRVNLY